MCWFTHCHGPYHHKVAHTVIHMCMHVEKCESKRGKHEKKNLGMAPYQHLPQIASRKLTVSPFKRMHAKTGRTTNAVTVKVCIRIHVCLHMFRQ